MTDIPEWAMQKAGSILTSHNWDERLSHHIARALQATHEAADREATERERSGNNALLRQTLRHVGNVLYAIKQNGASMEQVESALEQIAAAIRKGTE